MNLTRDALVKLERNMKTTLTDNARTRVQCAEALQAFERAVNALDGTLSTKIARALAADDDRLRALEAPWTFLERLRWLFTGSRQAPAMPVEPPPEGV